MSWVSLEYTDNLGPEADIPALLAKLAGTLRASGGFEPREVRASATKLSEYVVGDERSDRAALAATLCLDAGQSEEFKSQLLSKLLGVIDAHFAGLYTQRTIALSAHVQEISSASLLRLRHDSSPPLPAEET